MASAPPKALETVVGLLLPPSRRQDVLGDLHERYTCRRRYIAEALCVVPLVIASRIRHTADLQMLVMQAFVLYTSLLAATWQLKGTEFLYEQQGFFRLAIPAAVGVLALTVGDAYAGQGKRSWLRPFWEAALGVQFALLSQQALWLVDRELVLPGSVLAFGCAAGLALISTLRLLFPPGGEGPRSAL